MNNANKPITATNFVVKCHTCGTAYLIRREKGLAQQSFLAKRPRCINITGNVRNNGKGAYQGKVPVGVRCGSLLGNGMFRGLPAGIEETPAGALLGWLVVRDTRDAEPKIVEKVVEVPVERIIDTDETAALRAEVDRLKVKYETPCPLMVHAFDDAGRSIGLRSCGGFLGHPGECAEVW